MSNFIKIQLGGSRNETRGSPGARTNRTSSHRHTCRLVFLVVTPCSLVEIYTFGEIYCLHNQDRLYLEDVRRRLLKKSVNSTRLHGITSS